MSFARGLQEAAAGTLDEADSAGLTELTERLLLGLDGDGFGRRQLAALIKEAEDQSAPIQEAFGGFVDKLVGAEVDGTSLLDPTSKALLTALAGTSSQTTATVRGDLAPQATTVSGESRTLNMAALHNLMVGSQLRTGRVRASNQDKPKRTVTSGVSDSLQSLEGAVAQDDPTLIGETMRQLAPQVERSFVQVAEGLVTDSNVQATIARMVTGEGGKRALLKGLGQEVSESFVKTLGCNVVNEEFVKQSLGLLPAIAGKLGIEGTEAAAKKLGKALLTEGAEEAVEQAAKVGAKKGVMGLLSTVPLVNSIPMLFTGAEMFHEVLKKPPDTRILGKGLATFGLQLGALAFPPLGLAATAVDLSGSVAIAVSDAKTEGTDVAQAASEAVSSTTEKTEWAKDAVSSSGALTSQALEAIAESFTEIDASDQADRARGLAQRAAALIDSESEDDAKSLQKDIGTFSFETLLPALIDQVRAVGQGSDEASTWDLMADGLAKVGGAGIGVRTDGKTGLVDPTKNAPRMKSLIQGIAAAGVAAQSLASTNHEADAAS